MEKAKKILQDIATLFCAALQTNFITDHFGTSKITTCKVKKAKEVGEDVEDEPRSGRLRSTTY